MATVNIPIETYKRHLEAVRILEKISIDAKKLILNPPHNYYIVHKDDIEAARKIVAELKGVEE